MAGKQGDENEVIDRKVAKVYEKCIRRNKELDVLLKLINKQGACLTSSLFIHGNTGTGKTYVVKTILECLEIPFSYVNCVEAFVPKLIYEKILSDIPDLDLKTCNTMMDFVTSIKKSSIADIEDEMYYIVFDKAERLRKMDDHVLSAFLRLAELTGLRVCVVFITEIVLEKFFSSTGFYFPFPVHFEDYSKSDVTEILKLDCPVGYNLEFYKHYCQLVVDVFFMICRDVKELRHLAFANLKKYCEPIAAGEVGEHEVRKLYLKMVPYLKKASQTVYLREISTSQWESMNSESKMEKVQVDLPYYAKYLLIAAYFASYNPANTDRRFFTKKSAGKLSKRAKTTLKAAKNQDKKLLGPKAFPMDRLMAIFYSIVPGGASSSGNILNQLSTLVTLNFVAKSSQDDVIEAAKYKCVVSLEFAMEIGKQVDLDVVQYLHEYT